MTTKLGKFNKSESESIMMEVDRCRRGRGLSVDELFKRFAADDDPFGTRKKCQYGVWKEICSAFPGRGRMSVYLHACRVIMKHRNKFPWSDDEKHELLELVDKVGPKWSVIGRSMCRLGENCRSMYGKLQRPRRSGQFSADEDARIIKYVKKFTKKRLQIKTAMDLPTGGLPWTRIAMKLGGDRRSFDYAGHWPTLRRRLIMRWGDTDISQIDRVVLTAITLGRERADVARANATLRTKCLALLRYLHALDIDQVECDDDISWQEADRLLIVPRGESAWRWKILCKECPQDMDDFAERVRFLFSKYEALPDNIIHCNNLDNPRIGHKTLILDYLSKSGSLEDETCVNWRRMERDLALPPNRAGLIWTALRHECPAWLESDELSTKVEYLRRKYSAAMADGNDSDASSIFGDSDADERGEREDEFVMEDAGEESGVETDIRREHDEGGDSNDEVDAAFLEYDDIAQYLLSEEKSGESGRVVGEDEIKKISAADDTHEKERRRRRREEKEEERQRKQAKEERRRKRREQEEKVSEPDSSLDPDDADIMNSTVLPKKKKRKRRDENRTVGAENKVDYRLTVEEEGDPAPDNIIAHEFDLPEENKKKKKRRALRLMDDDVGYV